MWYVVIIKQNVNENIFINAIFLHWFLCFVLGKALFSSNDVVVGRFVVSNVNITLSISI